MSVAKAFSRHKVPREIDRLRDELRYQSFSTAVKSPGFPGVGTYKESKHTLSTTPGGQISDQKSFYAPFMPQLSSYLSRVLGGRGGGFN